MCNDDLYYEQRDNSIAFRYHPNASISALRAAFECLRQGNGMPSFENNTTKVEQLMGKEGNALFPPP